MNQWQSALSFLLLSAVVGVSMLVIARVLRVRAQKESPLKRQTYECGEEPEGLAWIRFHPRYYVVALVFVLFDVEAVFLFPWAVSLRGLGMLAIVDMLVFVGILLLGWVYALRKGALKWQ
ncbi:MAG: NADH-quinone oxidoreductase subunit A [Myxococcales bacterium]|nr:NADH-quinone oxidoreductase subunit A [Myxococcales bacterium]MCB9581068.1 NADH-quinone oxidoreductase subunit A [Polyangiaceae bacterium]